MPKVVWEEPPTPRRAYKRNRYVEAIGALLESPDNWARIDTFDNAATANSARNNLKYAVQLKRYRLPEAACSFNLDVTVRKIADSQWGMFARVTKKEEEPNGEVNS